MTQDQNKSVGILGYGRFGQVLKNLLSSDFAMTVYDPNYKNSDALATVLAAKTIFVAVPIRQFEETIKNIASQLQPGTTVIDVCSVKIYPVQIMQKYLPENIGIIATHPLFGPDSIQETRELKIMMHPTRDIHHCFNDWKNTFKKKNLTILEMTPDEHDRFAAQSQGITHFIGRSLEAAKIISTPIDTLGFQKLLSLKQQTCQDTFELFTDLLHFNPYSHQTLSHFLHATEMLFSTLNKDK